MDPGEQGGHVQDQVATPRPEQLQLWLQHGRCLGAVDWQAPLQPPGREPALAEPVLPAEPAAHGQLELLPWTKGRGELKSQAENTSRQGEVPTETAPCCGDGLVPTQMHMLLPGTGATNLYPSRQLWEIFCQACCQAGRMPEERRRRAEEEARRDKNHSLSGPLAWPLCRKQNISGDAEVLQRGLAQEKGEGMPPTREGAVCPDVVQEETGREDQEDEQEPWPGEASAFHLAQQLLGQAGEDEAPSPHGSRRWGSSCTAALTTHPRLPSGNQCHLPSSWEDGRAPSTICPQHVLQTSRRRVSSLARAGSK